MKVSRKPFKRLLWKLLSIMLNTVWFLALFHVVRTSSAHPSGFCVFRAGDPEVCGTYMATRESFGDIPVFVSSNGCRLFRQVSIVEKCNLDTYGS